MEIVIPPQEVQMGDVGVESVSGEIVKDGPVEWADFNKEMSKSNPPIVASSEAIQEVSATPVVLSDAKTDKGQPVEKPAIPVVPEAQAIPESVPNKFIGPDGQVQIDKLVKSYRELERERTKMYQVNPTIPQGQPVAQSQTLPQGQPLTQAPDDPFVAQLDNDIKTYGAAPVLARLFEAATESAYRRATSEVRELKESAQADRFRRELEHISRTDPDIISEDGYKKLTQVLRDNPHLMSSPTPFTDAYAKHKYLESVRQQGATVQPNPRTQTAPVVPVQGARPAGKPVLKLDTPQDLDNHLKTLTASQQDEFWAKFGTSIGWKNR